jgi:hypothetical protein
MPSRVTIYDHDGTGITEIDTATVRSWILGDIGRCQFAVPTFNNPKCDRTTLQYGNFVVVEHLPTYDQNGVRRGTLPPWVGVILPPQEWDFGSLVVTAYSAECLFSARPMPYQTITGTAGTNFQTILALSNPPGAVAIRAGNIYNDSPSIATALRLSAYDEIKKLAATVSQDWDVTYSMVGKKLVLLANWYSQRGVKVNQTLSEGPNGNLRIPRLTEQGTLSNTVIGYNNAASATKRLTNTQNDNASGGDYGYLGINQVFSVEGQTALNAATLAYLNLHSRAAFTLEITALDQGLTFDSLDVGNVWTAALSSVGFYGSGIGFQGLVRICGMEYDDRTNECKLQTQTLTVGTGAYG